MSEFSLSGEYIKLGQLLKASGLVGSGSEAKDVIVNGEVSVNGEVCTMRGRKIVPGDTVEFGGETVSVY
ncbi:MAG: RNA-binding S4 domain-containing protein [Lachnospiraceae bacterium]|nr:RNA-binding S4 domain-containing protein [Lachnospiraceae bacterium]